ncbi:MAG TPA: type II toxin-antitoxin system PemK/MazF family toxin [Pirellulales bacterium]|jgi:mRNA interferase MazF|nr:type II toxin-antitoxin system PemK/MazF family toxin [Pirellulales bacterium]
MNVHRGEIVLVPVRFSSGQGQKVRPVLVVQSDHNNVRLADTIVAIITSNIRRANVEQTQILIDVAAPDGRQSERLHTILQADVQRKIGSLSAAAMQQIDACLKVSLGII